MLLIIKYIVLELRSPLMRVGFDKKNDKKSSEAFEVYLTGF